MAKLCQFYTTNYTQILQGLTIPNNIKTVVEPFAGTGELVEFINKQGKYEIECYDLDPKLNNITKQDTLKFPPKYKDKYVITNPPYLARNKSDSKTMFDLYKVNDLYKCFIKTITNNPCLGGIIIIPLNFWSSIRKNDIELRELFLSHYDVLKLNIFEEQVFDDTAYSVCSFQFELRNGTEITETSIIIYPSKTSITAKFDELNNYMIGGELYNLDVSDKYKITRLTSKNKEKANTKLLVKCIDSSDKINMSISDLYVDETENQPARTYATLIIEPEISIEVQEKVAIKFNKILTRYRKKYNSLFLTNYRENGRKRISFDLIYSITGYILDHMRIS